MVSWTIQPSQSAVRDCVLCKAKLSPLRTALHNSQYFVNSIFTSDSLTVSEKKGKWLSQAIRGVIDTAELIMLHDLWLHLKG